MWLYCLPSRGICKKRERLRSARLLFVVSGQLVEVEGRCIYRYVRVYVYTKLFKFEGEGIMPVSIDEDNSMGLH